MNNQASENSPAVETFKFGDIIRFTMVGHYAETAKHMLPLTRDRTYLGIVIVEKNGRKLSPPSTLEVGLYNDELPAGIKITTVGDRLGVEGLDITKILQAPLVAGLPRAQKAGQWALLTDAPFIDVKNSGCNV